MKIYDMVYGIKQDYALYTQEDFEVWKRLFNRQMKMLNELGAEEYLQGIKNIGFEEYAIPVFDKMNEKLQQLTGWEVLVAPGIINEPEFFQLLSQQKFPATSWLRNMSQLDYLSEPDMFHDVFGHVPLLTNQWFCDFFKKLGEMGVKHIDNAKVITMLGRIYWFTVEFGLINCSQQKKIYGAGIISSYGETKFALSDVPKHHEFDAATIMNTDFDKEKIQEQYFIIDSFEQLYNSIPDIEKEIALVEKAA